ncbi:MAG: hypothetical protein IJD80_03400 [Oscillospiraceae bacterium]|nr:hypothetical protein [Oscillospiraceae bacterium]
MKNNVLTYLAILAMVVVFTFIGTYDMLFNSEEKSEDPYALTDKNYKADDWFETVEHDGYTVTKHMTMGAPSVLVEFYKDESPVTVTITRGSKTTLVYSDDRFSYDMYISYRNDVYMVEDDFKNLDEIVSYAFDWSADTYMGTYTEELLTDENGNTVYIDEDGNTQFYRYEDEIE